MKLAEKMRHIANVKNNTVNTLVYAEIIGAIREKSNSGHYEHQTRGELQQAVKDKLMNDGFSISYSRFSNITTIHW